MLKFAFVLMISVGGLMLSACAKPVTNGTGSPAEVDKSKLEAEPANSNVEELSVLINVSYEAEEVTWRQSENGKTIVAVLKVSDSEAARLVSDAMSQGGASKQAVVTAETWFPPELIAQSGMSGDNVLKGQSYPADKFFQPPYTSGRIIRVENTNYFIIELSAA